jgi:hypothetical protein
VRTDGLSGEEATAIEAFAAEARAGLEHATPADWRRLYETLRIRGAVSLSTADDPEAVRLGRRYHFRIERAGAIQLLDTTRTAP